MEVTIKLPGGKAITLHLESNDTIKTVKSRICSQTEIPVDQQNLIYKGTKLPDDKTISCLNIEDKSTMYLILSGIKPSFPNSSPGSIRITCMISESDGIVLDVKGSDTVKHLRELISEKFSIEYLKFNLFFNGKKLDNKDALMDCGITEGSIIIVFKFVPGC